MIINNFLFKAEWKEDCGGKYDFDIDIIHIETRYWPDYTAIIHIFVGENEIFKSKYIEGETEVECKYKVEKMIKEKIEIILEHIKNIKL